MAKRWFNIQAAAPGSDTGEVSILDYIGAYGVDARSFLRDFKEISAEKVRVVINSGGGDVMQALAMMNGMRATGKHITVEVLGLAASAASLIAMVGDRVVMPENTFMFLHNPISGVWGNAEEMRSVADDLDKIGASLTATYAARWKGTAEELKATLDGETYLTAAECLAFGLCDEVTPAINVQAAAYELEDLPANVRAVFEAAHKPAATPEPEPEPNPEPGPLAEQIAAKLKGTPFEALTPQWACDAALTEIAHVDARLSVAREIQAYAKVVGLPDQALALVREGKTVVEARKALADVLAAQDEARPVNTRAPSKTVNGAKAPDVTDSLSPSSIWAEINAEKARSTTK